MRIVMQRVSAAQVVVADEEIASIGSGMLLLVGLGKADDEATVAAMLDKVLHYRVFNDEHGKMNRSLQDINGELLLVSQFTLLADTGRGRRPDFAAAMPPQPASDLFDRLVHMARQRYPRVACGQFGADMAVSLTNAGPVTLVMDF